MDHGRVHNGTALHHMSGLHHNPVDGVKKQLVQTIVFPKMAEIAQRCFIRNRFRHEVNTHEFPHGIAVVSHFGTEKTYGFRRESPPALCKCAVQIVRAGANMR